MSILTVAETLAQAAGETNLQLSACPDVNPFGFEQVMTREHVLGAGDDA